VDQFDIRTIDFKRPHRDGQKTALAGGLARLVSHFFSLDQSRSATGFSRRKQENPIV
jgi:hypothetical protein